MNIMMKRLSFTSDSSHLLPPSSSPLPPSSAPGGTNSPLSASPRAATPSSPSASGYPFPLQSALPNVDRTTLHRSLESLSSLLVALDEFRDLSARMAKAEKKVAKASRELAIGFAIPGAENTGRNPAVAKALGASAALWDALSEVDLKHSKSIQKDYEAMNDLSGKFFKKIAKEEKSFDDNLASLDSKVRSATLAYEKSRPRARPAPSDVQTLTASHDKYISSLSSLSAQIATLKQSHGESTGDKREKAIKEVGRMLCGVSEGVWRNRVEGTKKGGEKVGEVVLRGSFCESGMPAFGTEEESPVTTNAALPSPNSPSQQSPPGATTLRGPRPLPTSTESYSNPQPQFQQQPLDPSLFIPAPGLPPNTYLVQVPGLAPPLPPPAQLQQSFLSTPLSTGRASPTPSYQSTSGRTQSQPLPPLQQRRCSTPAYSTVSTSTPIYSSQLQQSPQPSPRPSPQVSPQSYQQRELPLVGTGKEETPPSSRSTQYTLSPFSSEGDTYSRVGLGSGGERDRHSRVGLGSGGERDRQTSGESGPTGGGFARSDAGDQCVASSEVGDRIPRSEFGGERAPRSEFGDRQIESKSRRATLESVARGDERRGTAQPLYRQEWDSDRDTGGRRAYPEMDVRKPEPRYGFEGGDREDLKRGDSTASERNFVARMKERYAEERERKAVQQEEARRDLPQPPRSNSRVSNLAQRYSSPAPTPIPQQPHQSYPSYSSNGTFSRSPPQPQSHKYSNSLQPYSRNETRTPPSEFGERERDRPVDFLPPQPPFSQSQPRSSSRERAYSRQSNPPPTSSSTSNGSDDPHPSVCGCEDCSARNYKGGTISADEEQRIQMGLRSVGRPGTGGRRLSMPVIFGGKE